jgi:hypothetical protein
MNLSVLSAVKNVKGSDDTDSMLKMLYTKFHQFSPMKMHYLKSVSKLYNFSTCIPVAAPDALVKD